VVFRRVWLLIPPRYSRLVSVLPKFINRKVYSLSFPVTTGWREEIPVARALPLSTEGVGWGYGQWVAESGPASGCAYAPCWGVPVAYGVVSGPSNRVGEQSSPDRRCYEHLQLPGRRGFGGRVLGPLEAARWYRVGGIKESRGVAARPPAERPGTFLACSCVTRPQTLLSRTVVSVGPNNCSWRQQDSPMLKPP